jgi:hypothetical protein
MENMAKVPNKTRIQIKRKTKSRLSKYGNITTTWDLMINKVLDHLEICDKWWCEKS